MMEEMGPIPRSMKLYASSVTGPIHLVHEQVISTSNKRSRSDLTTIVPDYLGESNHAVGDGNGVGEVWKLDHGLPSLPAYNALGKSSMRVSLSVETVLNRISEFIRLRNLFCSFDAKEARISCRTESLLHFVIYLWQGPESSVIVELQRRQGCSIELQQLRKELFPAIETGCMPSTDEYGPSSAKRRRKVSSYIKQMVDAGTRSANHMYTVHERVEVYCTMLTDLCIERHRLGLEGLLFLSEQSGSKLAADRVARALVYGDGDFAIDLRNSLLTFLRKYEMDELSSIGSDESEVDCDQQTLVLRILCNALETVAKEGRDDRMGSFSLNSKFWTVASFTFRACLRDAVHHPQEAAISVKCVTLVLLIADGQKVPIMDDELISDLERARAYGKSHHYGLEQESTRLIGILEARKD